MYLLREKRAGQHHLLFIKGEADSFSQKPHYCERDKVGLRVQLHRRVTK